MIEVADTKLYTASEVAKQLKCSEQTVHKYIRTGRIKARRIGKMMYINEYELMSFLGL
jgi:excisionase family DNA binding protein